MENNKRAPNKWYYSTSVFIIAFLCIGPFAMPLVWFNPQYSKKTKIVITVIIAIISYLIGLLLAYSLRSISTYYGLVFQSP